MTSAHTDPWHRLLDGLPVLEGTETVIVAHNNSRASDNPWAKQINSPRFMTDTARNILAVMGRQHVILVKAKGIPRAQAIAMNKEVEARAAEVGLEYHLDQALGARAACANGLRREGSV